MNLVWQAEEEIPAMGNSASSESMDPEVAFEKALSVAVRVPMVRISRDDYLRKALRRYCAAEQIEAAVNTTPAAAGIDLELLKKVANESISWETTRVTTLSTVAGIPGGMAALGTIPADLVQNFGHILRIAQKLAYLYSWPEMFSDDDDLDDATRQLLVLFMGVMFGVKGATDVVTKVATAVAAQTAKKLPQKALTKVWVYQITKKIATQYLGKTMNKKVFSSGVAKFVPIVGGVVSGGITYATFRPMCARLRDHLAGLDLADPKASGTQR